MKDSKSSTVTRPPAPLPAIPAKSAAFKPSSSILALSLGDIYPNPAIQTNRVYFFLALNCVIPDVRKHFPDHGEDITVELFDVKELSDMVAFCRIDHSLSALCVMKALKHINSK